MIRAVNPPPRQRVEPREPVKERRKVFRKIDLLRAVDAITTSGLNVRAAELRPDGTMRFETGSFPTTPDDEFAQWEPRL